MSKISVTTIAGLTSGGDANTVKIESGDTLQVESNATVGGTLTTTGTLTANGLSTLVGSTTHGTDAGDTRFNLNGPNQYRAVFKHAGNIAGQIGGGGADDLRFSNAAGATTMSIKDGHITMPTQPAFSATATTTNIPLTTQTTVTLSSPRFNVGSHLSGNTFTAPISGKYLFTYLFYFTQLDASHTTLDVHIKTSNKQYQQTWNPSAFMGSDSNFSVSGSQICDMDANDTTYFAVYVQGGGAQTDIHGDSQVSGCLLL